jgi:hypothetical protein
MAAGEMTSVAYKKFLSDAMRLMADNSRDGSLFYVCTDWRHIGVLLAAAANVFAEHLNICVWEKNNAGMGSFTGANMSSFRSTRRAVWRTATTSNSAVTVATARTSGATRR